MYKTVAGIWNLNRAKFRYLFSFPNHTQDEYLNSIPHERLKGEKWFARPTCNLLPAPGPKRSFQHSGQVFKKYTRAGACLLYAVQPVCAQCAVYSLCVQRAVYVVSTPEQRLHRSVFNNLRHTYNLSGALPWNLWI